MKKHSLSAPADREAFIQEAVAAEYAAYGRPRCVFDVYLLIERIIDEMITTSRQQAKHSAELKIRLATFESVKGRVQQARRQ